MKLIRSSLLVAAVACVLAGCSANVGSGSDSNGGGGGIVEHAGTGGGAGAGMAGPGGSAAAGSSGGLTGGDSAGAGGEQDTLTLSSSAFAEMGPLGAQYQCGATGVSPPLSWTAGPEGTHSYAVVMVGPDSSGVGSLYHWVIWDIPAATTNLPEAVAQLAMPSVPAGSSQISPGTDGATWQGYAGPCSTLPTAYTFTVFALEVPALPGVTPASTGADVFAAIRANTVASGRLTVIATHYKS